MNKGRKLFVVVGALVVAIAVATPLAVRFGREHAKIVGDGHCLSAVGMVVLLYAEDHGGAFPDSLEIALRSEDQNPSFAFCKVTSGDPLAGDPRFPYAYLGRRLTTGTAGPATVIAHSPLAFAAGAGANVCFGDARVQWIRAADLPAVLARGGPATQPTTFPAAVQSPHG